MSESEGVTDVGPSEVGPSAVGPSEVGTVALDGTFLAYEEAGSGPAVVFSHAGLADRRMWEHQFRHLATDHRVISYDWRGYGDSGDAAGEFSHHRDLLGLLDARGIDQAVLVGCSMGGSHCLEVALVAPERVRALVLICSGLAGHEWPPEMLAAARERIQPAVPADRLAAYRSHSGVPVREEDVRAMAEAQARFLIAGPDRDPSQLDPAMWRFALTMCEGVFRREWNSPLSMESVAQPPAVDRLGEVAVPALVINGLADAPWVQAVSDRLSAEIPGAVRRDLPDTGHLPPIERPAEVTSEIRRFLDRLP